MKHRAPRFKTTLPSPLGPLLLAASDAGLSGVWFCDQRHFPDTRRVEQWTEWPAQRFLDMAAQQLTAYFDRSANGFDLPLDLSDGTAFQQSVWLALRAIPRGQALTYGTVAERIGKPLAVRAVGAAIGRNPLSIVVPCHRVLGANGSLTGYAGGLERKAALLRLEGARV